MLFGELDEIDTYIIVRGSTPLFLTVYLKEERYLGTSVFNKLYRYYFSGQDQR